MGIDSQISFAAAPSAGLLIPFLKPLHIDEKVWSLYERDELTPDGKQLFRVQAVRVERDRRLVEFTRVLGRSEEFTTEPFAIIILGTESVGRAMDRAEAYRRYNGLQRAMDDHLEEVDVVQEAIKRAEMMQEYLRRNHRTTSRMR